MNKLTMEFQKRFSARLIFDQSVFERIDPAVKLHEETKGNPLSSSAACLNVIGSIASDPVALMKLLGSFGLEIEELYAFPSPVSFGDRIYNDKGYAIFEWVGPQDSPINETGGGRGYIRTSVDAFVLGRVNGKTTQILIEWKFTEGLSRELALGRFCGGEGIERLRRYSLVLAELRKQGDLPFDFDDEYGPSNPKSSVGMYDFSPDHLYQLLRMTLLAKKTTGSTLGKHTLEDYRIVHLTHSQNDRINVLHPEYLLLSPGLKQFSGQQLHEVWKELLSPRDRERFVHGHWDRAIHMIAHNELRAYLSERYV
jgi:restriction endonuclease-like protein